jgi:lipoprotein-anchoring transpeptidase ErfK/SrfK
VNRRRQLALLALVAAALPAGAAAAAGPTLPPAAPAGVVRVSDERTTTRWAYAADVQAVYSRPSESASRVARLRTLTEDGFPEVYVVLDRWTNDAGNTWLRIRVPMRPNGVTGWVHDTALGALHTVHTALRIDRRALRLTLFDRGRRIFSARIGVGKASTPTPAGRFYIREKFRVSGVPLYGPAALGTSAYAPHLTDWPGGGVVGLHGTDQPRLIPGRPSHGCIRLRNRDILRLYRLVPRGTPVEIV